LIDIVGSLAGLVILSPLMGLVYPVIRLRLGTPVLFRQARLGKFGHPFVLYKFRTMTDRCDSSGDLLPDVKRLTPFGYWLRRTSIDELPQLFNVFLGKMSLVGPRPLLPEYLERYNSFQCRRQEAKPGITGWAQVNGRNLLTWEEKFRLDVWYVDHQGLWLDLRILGLTVLRVLCRSGVSAEGSATMPEFLGCSRESNPKSVEAE
jgi:lipopolysaccharide/colanic/teichoic acid biosynthesis glycosyltransferase